MRTALRAAQMVLLSLVIQGCGGSSDSASDGGPDGQIMSADGQTVSTDGETVDARAVDGTVTGGCVHPAVVAACSNGWCAIPAGCFSMGSPTTEACRRASEDQHQVTLTHSLEIARTEVTQGQFQQLLGYNPSSPDGVNCGTNCPVQRVSKHEAMAYCNALSTSAARTPCYTCTGTGASVQCQQAASFTEQQVYSCPGYRLPTDAEWEYAYRAGTTTPYHSGNNDATACTSCASVDPGADAIGWYCANYNNLTSHQVALKQANAWGLHDMGGNVAEWCDDTLKFFLSTTAVTNPWNTGSANHTIRGGHYGDVASSMRAASRLGGVPATRIDNLGLRCVRSLD